MNKLIKNYIYAVIRRVSNGEKEEIARELEANIYDMLAGDESDENIKKVLKEIGSPILVAAKYVKKEKHIVHPMFYYDYLTVLKIVIMIGFIIAVVTNVFSIFTPSVNIGNAEMIVDHVIDGLVDDIISSIYSSIAFVTVLFYILSNNLENEKVKKFLSNFNPEDVLDAPKDLFMKAESKLSIYLGAIIGSFFAVLFSVLFIVFYENLGIYENGEFIMNAINMDYRLLLSSMVGLSAIIFVVGQMYYMVKLKKDLFYNILDVFHSVFSIICAVILMTLKDLLNPSFTLYMANVFDMDVTHMEKIFSYGLAGILALIVVISIIEIIVFIAKKVSKKLID